MAPEIVTLSEQRRGCGYRQPGGKYIIGGKLALPCGKLPHVLAVCPTCGHGIKPVRSWTWVNAATLFADQACTEPLDCPGCPLNHPPIRAGLLWIGSTGYATPEAFSAEAARIGISRRLPYVPKDFQIGETLILLAHRQVQVTWGHEPEKAIFAAFIPTGLDYVVTGTESPEQLDWYSSHGFRLVKVERAPEL